MQGAAAVPTRLWAVLQPHGNSSAKLCFSLLSPAKHLICCEQFRDEDAEVMRMHNLWCCG